MRKNYQGVARTRKKRYVEREITDEIHHRSEHIVSKMMHFIEGKDRFPFLNIDTGVESK
jgi:hypothetical protein